MILFRQLSHDIRSPLSSIISVVDCYSGLDPEKALELVGSISKYMLEFVNCLLLSLQAEATGNSMKLFHECFNVSELLQEIKVMMEPVASQKQTSILVQNHSKDMMVTDKTKLTQIIMNFVSNSIKFTVNGNIFLSFQKNNEDKSVKFIIEDTGTGMSEETRRRIFTPFSTAGNKMATNSQGIGLCKHHNKS